MMRILLLVLMGLCWMVPASAVVGMPTASAAEQQVGEGISFLKPIQRQVLKWQMVINREIPQRMKALKDHFSYILLTSSAFAAFLYGVLHTLGPGHGKMVVGTYFLTHGAQFWRGVFVGAQVAFSHVAGAVVLVLVTDVALRQILTDPDAQVFWARVVSYLLIMAIGAFMLVQAVRKGLMRQPVAACGCGHHHDHGHAPREALLSWCVGAVPCTGSLLILLYAMAQDMMWVGLLLVLFVALGMALTMMSIGWLCILGKIHVIDRYVAGHQDRRFWRMGLEMLGAVFIMAVGGLLLLTVLG